ncbi:MAG: DUF3604 domain-containing protein [Actinomycetota bacterium]|nr:DUF3604 domain-containing protein [Actinomycetota bacterium]
MPAAEEVESSYRLTSLANPVTNLLDDPVVARRSMEELDAMPFLGTVSCSHTSLIAGSVEEILIDYTVGSSGIADSGGVKLCYKFYSDWQLQTDNALEADYCSVEYRTGSLSGGASSQGTSTLRNLRWRYDEKGGERPFQKAIVIDLVDGYLRPGDHLLVRLGDRRAGGPGTRAQTFVERAFCFRVMVDPLGTQRYGRGPDLLLDVVASPPARVVINTPRVVRSGANARVVAHVEDAWGNPIENLGGSITMSAKGAMERVWSMPVPQSGWACAEIDLEAPPSGETRFEAVFEESGAGSRPLLSSSAFIDSFDELGCDQAYFGDLHVHTNDTVGTNDNEYNFSYAREVSGIDFMGYTANDFQITDQKWSDVVDLASKFTDEGRFVCFPGVEWCGTPGVGGDHNVVFIGTDTTLARSVEWHEKMGSSQPQPQAWPIARLYQAYEDNPEDYLLIPHVGGRRAVLDWHHPALERLIEVHSAWGPDPWFFEDAMRRGLRLGASGASDEHRGRPGGGHPGANIFGSHGGLCGLVAPALERSAVGRALRSRHTWATTGARLVALVRSDGHIQGDEVFSDAPVEIAYNLFGDAGWEVVRAYDGAGVLWERRMDAEYGYSSGLVRLRWGGARVKDRYRWVSWSGSLAVSGSAIDWVEPWAFQHAEHRLRRSADARGIEWSARTYGDSQGAVIALRDLGGCRFALDVELDDGGQSRVTWEVDGRELESTGHLRKELGGIGLYLSLERLSGEQLPRHVKGSFSVQADSGPACVYLRARQRDGHEVWTSPLFVQPQSTSGRLE